MTMERKIGEIFEYNGEWYQCVKDNDSCECCDFTEYRESYTGNCDSTSREDGESICFKKLENVGEPITINGTLVQKMKTPVAIGCEQCVLNNNGCSIVYEKCFSNELYVMKQNQETMEENKIRLRQKEIDFLRRKFKEITQDYVIQGCDREKIQYEFGMLFESTQGPYNEEKKMNLKPFDIEAARSGKTVCTRDGRKARIICFDRKNDSEPIVALIDNNGYESNLNYNVNGRYKGDVEHCLDLMMLPEKKEGWVNVYKERCYETKEEALKKKYDGATYVDTVKIEWEE